MPSALCWIGPLLAVWLLAIAGCTIHLHYHAAVRPDEPAATSQPDEADALTTGWLSEKLGGVEIAHE